MTAARQVHVMADEDATDGDADDSDAAGDDDSGAVGFLRTAFTPERVAAWLLVIAAVIGTLAIATGFGATVATDHPEASFAGSYDAETNVLVVEHAGGDAISAGPTDELVVVVSDAQTGHARNVTWVEEDDDGVGSFPVEPGDSIAVDGPTVDSDGDGDFFDADATVGFELDVGDEVRVVWRGRPLGAPDTIAVTLDEFTVGSTA